MIFSVFWMRFLYSLGLFCRCPFVHRFVRFLCCSLDFLVAFCVGLGTFLAVVWIPLRALQLLLGPPPVRVKQPGPPLLRQAWSLLQFGSFWVPFLPRVVLVRHSGVANGGANSGG